MWRHAKGKISHWWDEGQKKASFFFLFPRTAFWRVRQSNAAARNRDKALGHNYTAITISRRQKPRQTDNPKGAASPLSLTGSCHIIYCTIATCANPSMPVGRAYRYSHTSRCKCVSYQDELVMATTGHGHAVVGTIHCAIPPAVPCCNTPKKMQHGGPVHAVVGVRLARLGRRHRRRHVPVPRPRRVAAVVVALVAARRRAEADVPVGS